MASTVREMIAEGRIQYGDIITTDGEYGGRDIQDEWRVQGITAYGGATLQRRSDGKLATLEGNKISTWRGAGSHRTIRKFVTVERIVRPHHHA